MYSESVGDTRDIKNVHGAQITLPVFFLSIITEWFDVSGAFDGSFVWH